MIDFSRDVLDNGLTLLHCENKNTPLVVVYVLYRVGSRDEHESFSGMAHLFEHLMFGGSTNIPDFDKPINEAGGDSNAMTTADYTGFYNILPKENAEIGFWLEADRMQNLNISQKVLDVQRKVVTEEFNESYYGEPYGNAWHILLGNAFTQHPYKWPTIGDSEKTFTKPELEDFEKFYNHFYAPANAVLVVSGNIDLITSKDLAGKYFGQIQKGQQNPGVYNFEPAQLSEKRIKATRKVPLSSIYMSFHMESRKATTFPTTDLLSDILSMGRSSRFYQNLVHGKNLFSDIDAYVTGFVDPGLFIIEGKLKPGVSVEIGEAAIREQLSQLQNELIEVKELDKVVSTFQSNLARAESSTLNLAMSLGYYELLGDANRINTELELYKKVTVADIQAQAKRVFDPQNCTVLTYEA